MVGFIDEKLVNNILEENQNPKKEDCLEIIKKAEESKGLTLEETAKLLQTNDQKVIQVMFKTAKKVKERIYGTRLVLFAPVYLSNYCSNNCLYCAFRKDNRELKRKTLTMNELKKEIEFLIQQGQKRVLLVAGEDLRHTNIDYLEEAIKTVYSTKVGNGEIRRLNINVAPLSLDNFIRLKNAKIGTYQLFQETYHYETYKKMHPQGPKADYKKRLYAMDLAQKAGIDDVGIGVLFGLYDYKFEVLCLLLHAQHLEEEFGTGPHTISVPRIEPALNAPVSTNPPYPVSDQEFKKLVAIIRLAVPYTGMILSTRENAQLRDQLFSLGISQISAGSRTNPGGYSESEKEKFDEAQFKVHDNRSLSKVIKDISNMGFLPSFCTACYRSGRTGDYFMQFAKSGNIQNFCHPNAILTFKEYLLDYADEEMKKFGEKVIQREIQNITNPKIKELTIKKLKLLEDGQRDLYF
ncbi:MAG: [FeFe] hydrogenase H-cluster radical SAM maturase HydG [Candidatus Micrarchaeota archaeon]|nr:[FeFe] hydrogenase H-cluster radical SAM maturase HydG [Candidatus Micrarchaeota archaeon]